MCVRVKVRRGGGCSSTSIHISSFLLCVSTQPLPLSSLSLCIAPRPSSRHTNNNYFLNAYQHIWLEIMRENADYGSLLSTLTVMWRSRALTALLCDPAHRPPLPLPAPNPAYSPPLHPPAWSTQTTCRVFSFSPDRSRTA